MHELRKPVVSVVIRDYLDEDAAALRVVFESSVHALAAPYYTREQLAAWAPREHDREQWSARLSAIRPFVAEVDGNLAGFADLQDSGYIEVFYVSGDYARCGVATALMARIHAAALERNIVRLHAHVSLAAEDFFVRAGFEIQVRKDVERAGVVLRNALMSKELSAPPERA